MTEEDLHDEIDELAVEMEQMIVEMEETNEKWDDEFESKHRRMEEASVDPQQLFS